MRRLKDKRVLVLLLAALLACACLPALAFAVGEDAENASDSAAAAVEELQQEEADEGEPEAEGDSPENAQEEDADESASADEKAKSEDDAETEPVEESEVEKALANKAAPANAYYDSMDADSAGTVFTFQTPIRNTEIFGDLFWAGGKLQLSSSRVDNDLMAAGREAVFTHVDVSNDVRLVAQTITFDNVVAQDNVNLGGFDIAIDSRSTATGFYCGGGTINYEGKSKRFIAYGQTIYFDGLVEGDVTLSAQEIIIGPHAKVTGTLDIRSGQNLAVLSIPETAQIGRIDTTLNQPNTIDQITQIRATIAPYFQVGSLLFVVVSFMLLGFAMYWGFGHKLTEANRLIRRYPLAVVVLGCIALMLMFVAVTLGALLVFTLPFAAAVLLAFLLAAIVCVPFTGASLLLMLRKRIRPVLCVIIGSGLFGALLFIPYVNVVVFAASMIYFTGYLVNIGMFGHDEKHDASFHHRETDAEAPTGKASGILPVAAVVEAKMTEFSGSSEAINEDWFVEGDLAELDEVEEDAADEADLADAVDLAEEAAAVGGPDEGNQPETSEEVVDGR